MAPNKFIFQIETEKQYNVLIRIISQFNRRKIPILELTVKETQGHDGLWVQVSAAQSRENAEKLLKTINREIDVLSVHHFEQIN
jgi:acetolactate synthase small subunit